MNYTVPSAITVGSFTTNLSFNSFLGLTNETGPNGDSLGIGYDAAARPVTTSSPYGAVTNLTFNDTASPPTRLAITNGHGTRTTLDGFGRAIKVETGTGTTTSLTTVFSVVESVYDSCGCSPLGKLKQTSMPYAPGGTPVNTIYAYDGMGRTLTQTAPDGSVTHYAYAGNSVTVTDPAGKWKQYYMDTLGNVSLVAEPNPDAGSPSSPGWSYATYTTYVPNPPSTSPLYQTYHMTSYSYDVLNHLTLVSMPRYSASSGVTTTQTRTFNYLTGTSVGTQLLSATNPENGTVTYTYGANNMIATKVDAKNQKIAYTYDAYNRVTEVQHLYWQFSYICGCNTYVEDTSQQVLYSYDTNPYDGGAYSPNSQGRLTAIAYQPMTNGNVEPKMQEWYSYSVPGSVTGKQMTVSQYNAPQGNSPS